MATLRCPTCQLPFDSARSSAMPFCSERCRQIDLGRWLNEEVGLPLESGEHDEYGYEDHEEDGDEIVN